MKALKARLRRIQNQTNLVHNVVTNIVVGVTHELGKLTEDFDDDEDEDDRAPLEPPRVVQDD